MANETVPDLNALHETDIEHIGTRSALGRHGIEVPEDFTPAGYEGRITVRGADGHDWAVWSDDDLRLCIHATRPRTEAEIEAWHDAMNSRLTYEWFSTDRQKIVEYIATELMDIADQLSTKPELGELRTKLDVLGSVQWRLVRNAKVDMASIRAELATVGLPIPQRRVRALEVFPSSSRTSAA